MSNPVAIGLEHFVEEYLLDPEIADHGDRALEVIERRLQRHAGGGIAEIAKAMDISGVKADGGVTGADALKLEDLLPVVTSATISAQDFAPAWNKVNKRAATSDRVEHTLITDLGGEPGLGFVNPGSLSGDGEDNDPDLERVHQNIRWYGHPYSTSLPATLVTAQTMSGKAVAGGVDRINEYAALNQTIIDLNIQHWHGNNSITKLEADGFLAQTRAKHDRHNKILRFNCNGKPLDLKNLPDIAAMNYENGAVATDFWWGPKVLADIEKSLLPHGRLNMGEETDLLNMPENFLVKKLGGQTGRVKTNRDLHLDPYLKRPRSAPSRANAPTKPSAVVASLEADNTGNVLDGNKLKADGPYYYSVQAVGVKGRSDARVSAGSVSPNGSQKAKLVITNAHASTLRFEIFRGPTADIATHKYLTAVTANGIANGADQTFYDDGEFIPGCSTGVLMCNTQQPDGTGLWLARQLLPISRYDLPRYVFNFPSIWLAGVCFQLRAPQFQIIVENIGHID
jgi:hypothetical protein